MRLDTWLPSAVLLLSAGSASAQFTCPDVRASNVPVRVDELGSVERCGLGIKLFGLRIGVFGPRCPDKKATYPAHGTCAGTANVGTYCVKGGDRDVMLEDCECDDATILGTGFAIPQCRCVPGGTAGTVEHFVTATCPELEEPKRATRKP